MRRLLPVLIVLLGLGGGVGGGLALRPASAPDAAPPAVPPQDGHAGEERGGAGEPIPDPVRGGNDAHGAEERGPTERSFVTIGNQTIVPVVDGGRTRALMLFELAVDVDPSAHDTAVMLEPRLRDAFLRELLKMSSTGAFTSTYTEDWLIDELRRNLASAARQYLGPAVRGVLVLDVVRQEM